eukprot:GHVP01024263.1.p1 GENE.GHVP01024263.1~~GHVP01024263.1.p1  ORF type:complete len:129 (+),score=27.17 GHVP01024263.1:538-924(+)
MGVDGFFKSAKDAEKHIHLTAYRGKKIAVDASCWLHKAVYICSYELIAQKPTSKHIDFCMKNTQLLIDFGIQPLDEKEKKLNQMQEEFVLGFEKTQEKHSKDERELAEFERRLEIQKNELDILVGLLY